MQSLANARWVMALLAALLADAAASARCKCPQATRNSQREVCLLSRFSVVGWQVALFLAGLRMERDGAAQPGPKYRIAGSAAEMYLGGGQAIA